MLAKGLEVPWGIAFLPDGSRAGHRAGHRPDPQGRPGDRRGRPDGHRGAAARRGRRRPARAACWASRSPPRTRPTIRSSSTTRPREDNRVAKLTLGGKPQPILTGIPRSPTDNGGQLAFGPDGFLYVGTGDGTASGSQAQNPKSLGGKILRITTAGKPAPGNPVRTRRSGRPATATCRAWRGTRPSGCTRASPDQKTYGELNLIGKGKNYGWPKVEGAGLGRQAHQPAGELADRGLLLRRRGRSGTHDRHRLPARPAPLAGEHHRQRHAPRPAAGVAATASTAGSARWSPAPDGSLWVSTSNTEDGGRARPDDDRLIRLVFAGGGAGRT